MSNWSIEPFNSIAMFLSQEIHRNQGTGRLCWTTVSSLEHGQLFWREEQRDSWPQCILLMFKHTSFKWTDVQHKANRWQRLDLPPKKWSWLGKSIQLEAQGHNDTKDKADVFVLRKLTTNITANSPGSTAMHSTPHWRCRCTSRKYRFND